jgi:uncharacterized protein YkwD
MPRVRTLGVSLLVVIALAALPVQAHASASSRMVRKINAFRAAHGLKRLHTSHYLSRASRRWSRRLMGRDYLGHSGARPRGFKAWGECLEIHYSRRAQVTAALRHLKASPPHRAILLSGSYSWIGAGRYTGRFNGHRATIWTIRVGRR